MDDDMGCKVCLGNHMFGADERGLRRHSVWFMECFLLYSDKPGTQPIVLIQARVEHPDEDGTRQQSKEYLIYIDGHIEWPQGMNKVELDNEPGVIEMVEKMLTSYANSVVGANDRRKLPM